MKHLITAASALVIASVGLAHAAPVDVDLELQLLVDDSGSIDNGEFLLQRDGYADAFRSNAIINAISNGAIGAIAVELIYWSDDDEQLVAVPWQLVNDATSANALADLIEATTRPFQGRTGIADAINFGLPRFATNDFNGTRLVQDISGDGTENEGGNTIAARNAAVNAGVTINALAIGSASLANYFENEVATADGFVLQASNFSEFESAIQQKLQVEITGEVPVPAPLLLMGSAIAGFIGRAKIKAAK
ncbi:MAG: DUF1194 domain-containing protein [Pseudomonadota bacterium]